MSVAMTHYDHDRPLRPGFLVGPFGWLNEYWPRSSRPIPQQHTRTIAD
jgi:hypothetical protein